MIIISMPKHNKIIRLENGSFSSPYDEKRSRPRSVRFPPELDNWLVSQKSKRDCTLNDLIIEAVNLLKSKSG